MPKVQLTDTLRSLRSALKDGEQLDGEQRMLLADLHDEIEQLLELSAEARPEQREVVQVQARGAFERFQASHPSLARAFGTLADTLSGMGI